MSGTHTRDVQVGPSWVRSDHMSPEICPHCRQPAQGGTCPDFLGVCYQVEAVRQLAEQHGAVLACGWLGRPERRHEWFCYRERQRAPANHRRET